MTERLNRQKQGRSAKQHRPLPTSDTRGVRKRPGGGEHINPPRKTGNGNPERNPRDQKGRGGSK